MKNNSLSQNLSTNCLQMRKENLLENIVAVEISASPYATEILAESPMYTWVDLISSIGGQTGRFFSVKTQRFTRLFHFQVFGLASV